MEQGVDRAIQMAREEGFKRGQRHVQKQYLYAGGIIGVGGTIFLYVICAIFFRIFS